MNGTSEVKNEPAQIEKEKSKSGSSKKGSKKRSTKSTSSKNKETTSEDKSLTENSSIDPNADGPKKGNFEGDFFKDFYYAQGDYKAEEAEENQELQHAADESK